MMRSITYKVPNGKLLRIRAQITDGVIETIELSGDFFLHPEPLITTIESSLRNTPIDEVAERIERTLSEHEATLIGCSPHDIEEAIRMIE